jgi:hypothetical protein
MLLILLKSRLCLGINNNLTDSSSASQATSAEQRALKGELQKKLQFESYFILEIGYRHSHFDSQDILKVYGAAANQWSCHA